MDWMKYRFLYFAVSLTAIGIGVFSLVKWGLKIGVDFTGGAIIEYQFSDPISTEEASKLLSDASLEPSSVQVTGDGNYLFRFPPLDEEGKKKVNQTLDKKYAGRFEELRFESVGPAVGPELVKKTLVALVIAAGLILLWVAYRFRSLKFGASAVLAMLHDSIILIGFISLVGHFFDAEVDFLFVTAMLTILSFSVHDTIVVYDRVRESQKKSGGNLYDLANKALTETMVRSLNNSFTIIFMLIALMLLGGTTIRWFAATLLVGTISGTYSSPFVAIPILITWDNLSSKIKKG